MKAARRAIFEFELIAPVYDRLSSLCRWKPPQTLFEKIIESASEINSVLDVGTGTGVLSGLFRQHARTQNKEIKIAGIDLSAAMLKECRKKSVAGLLARSDANEGHIPFLDKKFDVVAASGVLDFISSLDNLSAEMARVARPGGIVAVTYLPARQGQGKQLKSFLNHIYAYAPEYVENAFAAAGIEKISSGMMTAYTHIWPVKYGLYVGKVPAP